MIDDLVISAHEYKSRIEKIRNILRQRRLDALYLTSPTRVLYSTGFSHISTERPLAVVIPRDKPIFFMGPLLEKEHVKEESKIIEKIYTYPDYPGKVHPIRKFSQFLEDEGLANSRIATDNSNGAAGGYGYIGPSLSDMLAKARFTDGRSIIDNMRLVKSNQEIRLLKESAKWADIAHEFLMETVRSGIHDVLAALQASYMGFARMVRKLGQRYVQLKFGLSPVVVGFRGQVGANSAIPHSVYTKKKIRRGDVLVTEAGVEVAGYTSELERTIVVGKPGLRARRYFHIMLLAQNSALKKFRPGVSCSSVDKAAQDVFQSHDLADASLHHTGHGIGLEGHEPPWLDPGDQTILREGMVFSCEPGLYFPGYAGFRHSDTVIIDRKGKDRITKYPRELAELTI